MSENTEPKVQTSSSKIQAVSLKDLKKGQEKDTTNPEKKAITDLIEPALMVAGGVILMVTAGPVLAAMGGVIAAAGVATAALSGMVYGYSKDTQRVEKVTKGIHDNKNALPSDLKPSSTPSTVVDKSSKSK